MKKCCEIVFKYGALQGHEAWDIVIEQSLLDLGKGEDHKFYGKNILPGKISDILRESREAHFSYSNSLFDVHYASVWRFNLSFISICFDDGEVGDLFCRNPHFIKLDSFRSLRFFGYDYEYWQNANDPIEYEAHNKSMEGINAYHDEALNHTYIDTSANPGRRVLRDGYIEAVGHEMWFGKSFWEATGSSLAKLLETIDCAAEEIGENVHKIKFQAKPFTLSSGDEAKLQHEIRDILFPKSSETKTQ